jgi:transcriptional regulator with XRE-family HTH domain
LGTPVEPSWNGHVALMDRLEVGDAACGRGSIGRLLFVRSGVDGEALLRARSAKGLTQHQLARIVHVAGGERVSGWERGASEPRARIVPDLARALGVDPMELLSLPHGVDLRALRLVSGLSAPELAQAVNVSVHSYLRWESGERLPLHDHKIHQSLAAALAVTTADVLAALEHTTVARLAE